MVTAFVLVVTKIGKEKDVLNAVSKLDKVQEAWNVYGDYDIITKVGTDDIESLNQFIVKELRTLPDVSMTTTLIGL